MADNNAYSEFSGEKAGTLRRLGDTLRTFGKNVRQFNVLNIGNGLFGTAAASALAFTQIETLTKLGAAGITALGNLFRVGDDLVNGQYNKAFKDGVAGTVETAIEAASGFLDSKLLWAVNIPSVWITGKYLSTHFHDVTTEALDKVVGEDKTPSQRLAEHMPGMQMGSLSSNQAALAVSPMMGQVPVMAQPAPGFAEDTWRARRAGELNMTPQELAARQGDKSAVAMYDARSAREAAMMQEQAMA